MIVENFGEGDAELLQEALMGLKKRQFAGAAVLVAVEEGKVHLLISVAAELTQKVSAGELLKGLAPIVGGRGGGKADLARGAGDNSAKLDDLLEAAKGRLKGLAGA